ncbi:hypothetical protein [Nocardia neocaledoniensis]|uniref:hypothetical protein n=1 Tax=Nocardia neocaledoniensis TaxID=236511 RepID=UPI002458CB1A|nr:hypothetical protein [Nocardia neocaledoniensis]
MSIPRSTTRAGLSALLAAAAVLGTAGTANAIGGLDWDLLPSGSVQIGPPTGSSMGSFDLDLGSGTGSFDADLGSSAPQPLPGTGSAAFPPLFGSAG